MLLGLSPGAMQRRPLHMVLLRGRLPRLNGHCVDGAATRVTITSDRDAAGRTVWQVGGQVAESGVTMDERSLVLRAKAELEATIPGIDLSQVEWATYRVDRAEGATRDGARPDSVQVRREHNVVTAWPTKLALVPRLVDEVCQAIGRVGGLQSAAPIPADWPRPKVAQPPWETARWLTIESGRVWLPKAA
jgi:hypothetical protein